MTQTLGQVYLKELEMEAPSTRKCLERITPETFEFKPHERSMKMGYLAQVVAEIPKWIAATITAGEVNFQTWEHTKIETTDDLVKFFDTNMEMARAALSTVTDEALQEMFYLKNGDQELIKSTKDESVSSSINHLVHHRGQLTVYMRLNEILVPSTYGPSADDKTF